MSSYKWNPERYARTSDFQDSIALKLLEKCNICKSDNIMDNGCGDGAVTRKIAELVPLGSVTGIEPDNDMIQHSITNSQNLKNINFIQKKASEIEFKNKFNWIFSFVALHWEKQLYKAFQNIYDSLVEGGTFLATMVPYQYPLHPSLFNLFKSKKWKQYFNDFEYGHQLYDTDGCRIFLTKCGFKINRLYWSFNETKMTKEKIIENFSSWAPLFRMPEEKQTEFLEDFFNSFALMLPQSDDGKFPYPIRLIYIEASK